MNKKALTLHENEAQLWLELYVPLVFYQPEITPQNEDLLFTWSDSDLATIAEGVLKNALTIVFGKSRQNDKTKEEVMQWLDAPPPPKGEVHHHFSFWACCQLAGVDHEEFHELVKNRLLRESRKNKH